MRLSSLPRFRTLLVHGPYPPSAPIHLALSLPPPHRAILFTPSRNALLQALQSHNDEWLNSRSGTGTVASMSSRVTVFYPPSPKHLVALLTMLRVHDVSSPSISVDPNMTLDRVPLLFVLHEPSAYFLPEREEHVVSSYLLLIIHALSTVERFASQSSTSSPPSLVVFDSRLDQLKLPVLRTPPRSAFDEGGDPEDVPRTEFMLFFTEKYFEFSGAFQSHEQTDLKPPSSLLVLRRVGGGEMQSIDCTIVD